MKRFFDIVLAAAALIALSPLAALIWLLVAAHLGKPVLFRQTRAGEGGRVFDIAKFRTMHETRDAAGQLLPDAQRVTGLGTVLRRFRLDELPQLWPILTGDMSFVGPRPLPPQAISGTDYARERLKVRPGLTGLAQVSGNTLLSNAEKFAIDAWYVHDQNPAKDIAILIKTVITILRGERRDETLIRKAMSHAQRLDWGR